MNPALTTWVDLRCHENGSTWLIGNGEDDPSLNRSGEMISHAYGRMERRCAWILNDLKCEIKVIIGGPGTGKTTLTRKLVSEYGEDAIGLSPTGKGAFELMKSIESPSYTIAMASVKTGSIPDSTRCVVIDEAGMLSIDLLHKVLMLIRNKENLEKLIICGDSGQLPPIGPGIVLDHLAMFYQATELLVNHRSKDAVIGQDCALVKSRKAPSRIMHSGVRDAIREYDRLVSIYGAGNVKIICPTNDDVNFFNCSINRSYIPVVCTRNNYDYNVFNGTQGMLNRSMIDWEGGLSTGMDGIMWKKAHAITCHKAQGGQWPAIVCYINSTRMVTVEWLNTAISRAQDYHVVICENPSALETALQRSRPALRSRKTLLLEFLQGTAEYEKGRENGHS